jgi:hypothetical protein
MTTSTTKQAFVAIVFGLAAAMITGIPGRFMVFESSMAWSTKAVAMALVMWKLFQALGILFYIPAAVGGFVAASIGPRRRREALVVGLLFIPGGIGLDYIRSEAVRLGSPIVILIFSLVPFFALLGARLYWFLFRRGEE